MIKKSEEQHGFDVECDNCGHASQYGADNTFTLPWKQLMALMRQDGWNILKQSGEWKHVCSACMGGTAE